MIPVKIETCKSFILLIFKKKTAEQIEEEINAKAYEIWKERNGQDRTAQDDWDEAAKILKEEAEQKKWYSIILNWTGLKEKKGWDIVQLLVVPLSLGLIGFGFQYFSKQIEQQAATNKNEQEILAKYLDQMSDLLEKGLLTSTLDSEKFKIARAKTIITLHSINPTRQHLVMQFLEASGLNKLYDDKGILFESPMSKSEFIKADFSNSSFIKAKFPHATLLEIDFTSSKLMDAVFFGAKLQNSKLIRADLRKADLKESKLMEADLRYSTLYGTEFHGADLSKAILIGAKMKGTFFVDATLVEANLSDIELTKTDEETDFKETNFENAIFKQAILIRVNLRDVEGLKKDQFTGESAPLICQVDLPEDFGIDRDRNCNELPKILHNRYPQMYPTIKKASDYIEKKPVK
jgi:uncharacterized protein YjbI with pentapeptide repeats